MQTSAQLFSEAMPMTKIEAAMRPMIDLGGVLQEVEARGFEYAGIIVFNPRTKEVGMLWGIDSEAHQEGIMLSLGIDPGKMRRVDVRTQ